MTRQLCLLRGANYRGFTFNVKVFFLDCTKQFSDWDTLYIITSTCWWWAGFERESNWLANIAEWSHLALSVKYIVYKLHIIDPTMLSSNECNAMRWFPLENDYFPTFSLFLKAILRKWIIYFEVSFNGFNRGRQQNVTQQLLASTAKKMVAQDARVARSQQSLLPGPAELMMLFTVLCLGCRVRLFYGEVCHGGTEPDWREIASNVVTVVPVVTAQQIKSSQSVPVVRPAWSDQQSFFSIKVISKR